MSLRMMRKMQEQQQASLGEATSRSKPDKDAEGEGEEERDDAEEAEEETEEEKLAVKPVNAFGLLWSELTQEDDEDAEEEEEEESSDRAAGAGSAEGTPASSSKKSRKKKKQKAKKKQNKEDKESLPTVTDIPQGALASQEASPSDQLSRLSLADGSATTSHDTSVPSLGTPVSLASAGTANSTPSPTSSHAVTAALGAAAAAGGKKEARAGPSTTPTPSSGKNNTTSLSKLIAADPGLLRAEDELKRIFGAKVMREVDKAEAASSSGTAGSARGGGARGGNPLAVPRGGARHGQGGGGKQRQGRVSAGRKFILVQPLDSWPPVERGGLMMEQVRVTAGAGTPGAASRGVGGAGAPGGSRRRKGGAGQGGGGGAAGETEMWFQYVESGDYGRVSRMLDECVGSHDPNEMVNLVAHHPYHAEGLFALSDVYRHMGEAQVAAELLERCLYVLESAWHPHFNPTLGTCRLDYAWEPNRILFAALWRNVQQLSRRGCHRAAFECAKLLLSLSPEDDPLGMLLCIDYFALRASQPQWLEDFVEAQGGPRALNPTLPLFPNFTFSLALAQRQREEMAEEECAAAAAEGGAGNVSGGTGGGGHEQSSELLKDALLLHPYVLVGIVSKTPIQMTPEWSKILRSQPFGGPHKLSPSLEHLSAIYSERSALLWRPTAVQKWLKATAQGIVEGVMKGKGSEMAQEAANWACVRQETFTTNYNEYDYLRVSEFSDNISTVPPEILMGEAGAQPQDAPGGGAMGGAQGGALRGPPPDLENRNGMMVFLETLLPWNDYGVDPNARPDRED